MVNLKDLLCERRGMRGRKAVRGNPIYDNLTSFSSGPGDSKGPLAWSSRCQWNLAWGCRYLTRSHCWTGIHLCVQVGRTEKPICKVKHQYSKCCSYRWNGSISGEGQLHNQQFCLCPFVPQAGHTKKLLSFCWALHVHIWPRGHIKKMSKFWWSGRRWEIQLASDLAEILPLWCSAILNSIIALPEEHSKQSYFGITFLL